MRNLIFCIMLISSISYAQKHKRYTFQSYNKENFAFLDQYVANKRIVFLGESDHGVKDYNEIKYRIIQHLHEKMGFEVVLFESSFENCNLTNLVKDSINAKQMLIHSLMGYWRTNVNYCMMQYFKKTGIEMGGIDPNVTAVYLSEKELQLIFKNPKLAKKIYTVDSLYTYNFNLKSGSFYQKYLKSSTFNVDSVANVLQPIKDSLKIKYNHIYGQIKKTQLPYKNLLLRAIRMRLITLNTSSYVDSLNYFITTGNKRNKLMAENLEYVLDTLYPNKKVIVWMHNVHIQKEWYGSITKYLDSSTVNNSFIIGLFARTGDRGGGTAPIRKVKHPWFNSLERKYGGKKAKGVFYPISSIRSKKWTIGSFHLKRNVTKLYDGIIILNDVKPSYMLRYGDTFKCELQP